MPLTIGFKADYMPPVQAVGYVGNAAELTIEGLSPNLGDTYVVSAIDGDATIDGTAAAVGDTFEFDGGQWQKIVPNSGGFPPEDTIYLITSGTAIAPVVGQENQVAFFAGSSLTPSVAAPVDGMVASVKGTSVVVGLEVQYVGAAGTWNQHNQVVSSPQNTIQIAGAPGINQQADVEPNFYLGGFYNFNSRSVGPAPATNQIPVNDTSEPFWVPGRPVRWDQGSGPGIAIIDAVVANTRIDIAGAPVSTAPLATFSDVSVGMAEKVRIENFFFGGTYGAPPPGTPLMLGAQNRVVCWDGPPAYLVDFQVQDQVADSVSQPNINIAINGSLVSTANGGNGPAVTTGAWSGTNGVNVNTANYAIQRGQGYDVILTVQGGAGDGAFLSVCLTWVIIG